MPRKQVDWDNTASILYFKEDPIYLRKDIVELHTPERWRKDGRQVTEECKGHPIRKVKGLYNNQEKEAELYGLW